MRWILLDAVPEDVARSLLATARRRRFRRGETVFHEGDPGESLHLVDKGFLAVRVATPVGDVATVNVLGPGDSFGDLALVSHGRRSATITTLAAAETLELQRAAIDELRTKHSNVDRILVESLAAEVRRLSAALLEAMYVPVPKLVARRLRRLVDVYGSPVLPLTQDDLAGMCGTTRQTANQVLIDLRARGAVELSRGQVRIVDTAVLERAGR